MLDKLYCFTLLVVPICGLFEVGEQSTRREKWREVVLTKIFSKNQVQKYTSHCQSERQWRSGNNSGLTAQ